jgi:two-component system, NtrC family, sensor histidine kinase HydH
MPPPMTTRAWVSLVAGIAHLAVGFIVLLRRTRSPLILPLVALCLVLFGWNFAALAFEVSGKGVYHTIDVSLSPFTAALGLHVIVAFVGRVRELRFLLAANYALFIGLILAPNSRPIELLIPLALVPMTIVAIALLAAHLRRNEDRNERIRTWAFIFAFVIAAVTGPLEYFDGAGKIPLGSLGLLVTTSLVAFVTVRFSLLGRSAEPSSVMRAVIIAAVCSLACIATYRALGGGSAVVIAAGAIVAIALGLALREAMFGYADERARRAHLATLGRLSSQLAHDLKNPLASVKGSLQYLAREPENKTLGESREFMTLMLNEVDRMARVIDDYQRIGRIEPVPEPIEINALVERVVALQQHAHDSIKLETTLANDLPTLSADPELLANALQNLIRNAFEATEAGGAVTVTTERAAASVVIAVSDHGCGMDPRQRASAFDEFYTTKATGSGLGLSFVRRVAEAHRGTARIESTLGRGTTVRLELPVTR